MPSNIIKELNRTAFTTRETTDVAATFAAYQIDRQSQPVLIHSIGYGGNTVNTTDRTNYMSQWCAIIRNAPGIDTSYGLFNSIAPINLPPGSDILWMDMINGLNGNAHRNFAEPFVLPSGDNYLIVTVSPYINTGFNAAIYFYVTLNAQIKESRLGERIAGWNIN